MPFCNQSNDEASGPMPPEGLSAASKAGSESHETPRRLRGAGQFPFGDVAMH